jgi:hypothetical protein
MSSNDPVPAELFAMRRGERLAHFYPSATLVNMCGTGAVVRVLLTPDDAGPYWCWWKNDKATMSMAWDAEVLFRMCSPDGFERAERNGEGKVIRVHVDVMREATVEELK